jgi:hypothetical protein
MYPSGRPPRHSGHRDRDDAIPPAITEGITTMTTQTTKPNWFAAGPLGQFMASPAGRVTRIVAGIVLIAAGLLAIGGTVGIIVAVIGLVPLAAGAFDVCIFSRLFGGPFAGSAIRALGGR